jgi:hypothetical protein
MNRLNRSFLLLISVLFIQCNTSKKTDQASEKIELTDVKSDGRKMLELGHKRDAFLQNEALRFNFELTFRGKIRAKVTEYISTTTDYIRYDYTDGKQLVFDGKDVVLSPDSAEINSARFDIFTWSYFFALPYKLTDPGTHWKELEDKTVNGVTYDVGKLTFGENVGDAPDDWYIIYSDKNTHLIKAAAYIVTYSKDAETAAQNPHAIVYNNYTQMNGIPLSNDWSFHNWNDSIGWTDTLGSAMLTDFKFLERNKMEVETSNGFRSINR